MAASSRGVRRSAPAPTLAKPVLEVHDLSVEFRSEGEWINAIDGVDLALHAGQTLGLVGESGSGKTVIALAIMGLLPAHLSRIPSGSVRVVDHEMVGQSQRVLAEVRGKEIGMIFQEPRRSLNPTMTVGKQIAEVLDRHQDMPRTAIRRRVVELLDMVGIASAEQRIRDYPYQFSGGMCQRVMLAIALACKPRILIADEPTTALDVTVQAQILDLIRDLQLEMDLAVVFITHDLAVVSQVCDEVAVMYAGQIVEQASVDKLLARPRHPYTSGLLSAASVVAHPETRRFPFIPGRVPALGERPSGCNYHPRCPFTEPGRCTTAPIDLLESDDRPVRCARWAELSLKGLA